MHRRIAPLLLAVLIALPAAVPASAADPILPLPGEPATEPTPTPDPTPTTDPPPASDPADQATPSADPPVVPPAEPAPVADPPAAQPAPAVDHVAPGAVIPDAAGRYIVMLRTGADTTATVGRFRKREGVTADRSYTRSFRGFSAKLDASQRRDILADPNVVAVVPDEVVSITQTIPTGVERVGGTLSDVAGIDGTDQRVDADVAIVDTGIGDHPDLNVAGGYNCSTADPTAWRDKNNHGTHVAGTVAALDNSFGVVGIAPGARVWAVKILNDDGYGLISWYICGLDWILAQRDPNDASRPLFEAANMSVTKAGADDGNCGFTNNDPLHQAICRLVAGGVTVVAAAANDSHNANKNIPASYDEVITVSALADTDGKPGGLGGNRCFSWGGYDKDDTFADFSNYGADVDLIAPGKCILSTIPGPGYAYMSGTSMAAPTVTGAVALYKASRPNATPAEVREALRYLGNLDWNIATDPDPYHEPLLDVSRIGPLGTFDFVRAATVQTVEGGTTARVAAHISRSATFFERVALSVTSVPAGWTAGAPTSVMGWTDDVGRLAVTIPAGTPLGRYQIGVRGDNQGRTVTATIPVDVVVDLPTANAPTVNLLPGIRIDPSVLAVRVLWSPATDPSSDIAGYEVARSDNGGAWSAPVARTGTELDTSFAAAFDVPTRFRVRAMDAAGHWSPWAESADTTRIHAYDDRSSAIIHDRYWTHAASASAFHGTVTGASKARAKSYLDFTGHGIAVVGPKNPLRGKVKVWIDGVYITTINMRSSAASSRNVVFTYAFPGGGAHRISLTIVGTGTYRRVNLDALVVLR